MNAIFDINRFVNYIKRDVLISRSHYLYLFGTLIGSYFLGLLVYTLWQFPLAAPIQIFLGGSILFAPCLLQKTITKYNGVIEFTFPVSTFERFLSMVLRYSILYPLIGFGSFYLLNLLMGSLPVEKFNEFAQRMSLDWINYKTIHGMLGVQSIFLVGYLYFNKSSFIKTCFSCIILLLTLSIFGGIIMAHRFITAFNSDMFTEMIESKNGTGFSIFKTIAEYFLLFLFPIGLWIVGFFKLREKEI